jgi:hypothetical protein
VDRGQRLLTPNDDGQRVSAIGNKRAEALEEPNPFSVIAEWSNPLGTTKRPWMTANDRAGQEFGLSHACAVGAT